MMWSLYLSSCRNQLVSIQRLPLTFIKIANTYFILFALVRISAHNAPFSVAYFFCLYLEGFKLKLLRKLSTASSIAAAALCITQVQAGELVSKPLPFKRMITFGDSLSDIGALKPPADLINQNPQTITQAFDDIIDGINSTFQYNSADEEERALKLELDLFATSPHVIPKQNLAKSSKSLAADQKEKIIDQVTNGKNELSKIPEVLQSIPTGTFSNGPVWNQYLVDKQTISTNYPKDIHDFKYQAMLEYFYETAGDSSKAKLKSLGSKGHLWQYEEPVNQNSLNYAVGGGRYARKGDSTAVGILIPGLLDQLAGFGSNDISNDTLVTIWLGANDAIKILDQKAGSDPQDFLVELKANMLEGLGKIYDAGGRHLLIPDVPDLSLASGLRSHAKEASAATKLVNEAIASVVADFKAKHSDSALSIYTPDMTTILDLVTRNPGSFGFSNTTDQCIQVENCQLNPRPIDSDYVFWDAIHPTTRAHAFISEYFATHWENPALAGSYFSSPTAFYDTPRHYFFPKSELAFGGELHGKNALYKLNDGTLTLTGNNSYTGGTFIRKGKLQIGNGGATGSITGNVELGNDALLSFYRDGNYTFDGNISGTGRVEQEYAGGHVTLNEANSYTGPTTVKAGGITVNGSIKSNVEVWDKSFLAGSGTVGGLHALAGSTVTAAGDSVGQLTVTGDAKFERDSRYRVNITADQVSADRTHVQGKATLLGGILQVVPDATQSLTAEYVQGFWVSATMSYTQMVAFRAQDFNQLMPLSIT